MGFKKSKAVGGDFKGLLLLFFLWAIIYVLTSPVLVLKQTNMIEFDHERYKGQRKRVVLLSGKANHM